MKLPQHPRIRPSTVRNLLALKSPAVHPVMAGATVRDALKLMADDDVGALVVLDGGRVAGIFSEREHARMAAVGAGTADATPVSHVMTKCGVFATPPQTVQACLELMNAKRLQYIPVIEGGRLLALLSIGDLLEETIAHYERIFQALELDQRILFLQGTYSC